jgi:hypothetical protein
LLASSGPVTWVLVVREVPGAELSPRQVGDALRLPVAARLPTDPAVRAAAARGKPPPTGARSAYSGPCDAVLDVLGRSAGSGDLASAAVSRAA